MDRRPATAVGGELVGPVTRARWLVAGRPSARGQHRDRLPGCERVRVRRLGFDGSRHGGWGGGCRRHRGWGGADALTGRAETATARGAAARTCRRGCAVACWTGSRPNSTGDTTSSSEDSACRSVRSRSGTRAAACSVSWGAEPHPRLRPPPRGQEGRGRRWAWNLRGCGARLKFQDSGDDGASAPRTKVLRGGEGHLRSPPTMIVYQQNTQTRPEMKIRKYGHSCLLVKDWRDPPVRPRPARVPGRPRHPRCLSRPYRWSSSPIGHPDHGRAELALSLGGRQDLGAAAPHYASR